MRREFLLVLLWTGFFSQAAIASLAESDSSEDSENLTASVVSVLEPERKEEAWIFLLSDGGRALRVAPTDRERIEILKDAIGQNKIFQMNVVNQGAFDRIDYFSEVTGVIRDDLRAQASLGATSVTEDPHLGRVDFKFSGYELTPQGIFDYFKSFRLRRGSQCFHRAYYWAHQLWRQSGVLSHKVFMFFTGKYIRRFNYHWWFHVAPFVYDENGQEVVLDPTFLRKPVGMRDWTNNFLRNDPHCPEVDKYLGHYEHARNEWCYVVKARMHYYHPNIIEKANESGEVVKSWDKGWLARARRSR